MNKKIHRSRRFSEQNEEFLMILHGLTSGVQISIMFTQPFLDDSFFFIVKF